MSPAASGYQEHTDRADESENIMIWKILARWALAVIAVPLAVAGVRRLSDAVESRRGTTRTTRFMRRSADTVQSVFGRPKRRRRWWR
jgi:hypothetical protein